MALPLCAASLGLAGLGVAGLGSISLGAHRPAAAQKNTPLHRRAHSPSHHSAAEA
ncbi:hypothetical protein N9J60_00835 [Alphaproteobacteria bacterium]|nr:hypothetical protein [Alphaproteobacteria bacterium]